MHGCYLASQTISPQSLALTHEVIPAKAGTSVCGIVSQHEEACRALPGPYHRKPTRARQTEVPAFAGMTRWITFLDWGRQMVDYGRYVVYLLASRKYGAIYVGVTGNLLARVVIHREELLPGSRRNTVCIAWFTLSSTTHPGTPSFAKSGSKSGAENGRSP